MIDKRRFMNRIKELRKSYNYTLEKLANKISVAPNTLNQYELERREAPYDILKKLAIIFDTTIDYILGQDNKSENQKHIKIPVLGEIRAGLPTYATENIIDYEEIPIEMTRTGEYFGLQVKGDSMSPRIQEGDVVIVRKQDTANSGDICVILVNGNEATLKKIRYLQNGIMLIPFNSSYEPLVYTKEQIQKLPVQILGKVVELRGKF